MGDPVLRETIVVAERLGLLREGLVALLRSMTGAEPTSVHAAASLTETVALLDQGRGGVLLLDLAMIDGPAGLREIRSRFPAWQIVVLDERVTRDGVLQCLAAGARGFVAKTADAAELRQAVFLVEQGGVHVPAGALANDGMAVTPQTGAACPRVATQTVPWPDSWATSGVVLTGRQRDVLRLMAEGRSTKDIARTLNLAVSTIKVHLAAVYRTVGARNRVEALCRAGLLPREAIPS